MSKEYSLEIHNMKLIKPSMVEFEIFPPSADSASFSEAALVLFEKAVQEESTNGVDRHPYISKVIRDIGIAIGAYVQIYAETRGDSNAIRESLTDSIPTGTGSRSNFEASFMAGQSMAVGLRSK